MLLQEKISACTQRQGYVLSVTSGEKVFIEIHIKFNCSELVKTTVCVCIFADVLFVLTQTLPSAFLLVGRVGLLLLSDCFPYPIDQFVFYSVCCQS